MHQPKNALELFKLLPGTNCRKCRVPTCLAFAAAVFRGEKRLEECPFLDKSVVERFEIGPSISEMRDEERRQAVERLGRKVADIDLSEAAKRLDAPFDGRYLTVKCLGKDFNVGVSGEVVSICHIHTWVTLPMLRYVLSGAGKEPTGEWVPFRELKGGADWARLYHQRTEKPLKRVADKHTDLFELMIDIFQAKPVEGVFDSDIAVVLYPLPKVPVAICYWKPEDELESNLNIFFDRSVEENLPIEALYTLITGMVVMFERIADTHGVQSR